MDLETTRLIDALEERVAAIEQRNRAEDEANARISESLRRDTQRLIELSRQFQDLPATAAQRPKNRRPPN